VVQDALTVIGEAEATGRPMEQAGLEMLFQLGDLAGYGRLAEVALA
jgi:hypothetical protein